MLTIVVTLTQAICRMSVVHLNIKLALDILCRSLLPTQQAII
jgi:hypothetical protein